MLKAIRQTLPAIAIWGAACGLVSFAILASESDTSVLAAAINIRTWTAAFIGAIVATVLAPLVQSPRIPWWGWALIGIPIGFFIMYLYFYFSPQGWRTEARSAWLWSLLFFFELHPWITIPTSMVAGGLGSHLSQRNSAQNG